MNKLMSFVWKILVIVWAVVYFVALFSGQETDTIFIEFMLTLIVSLLYNILSKQEKE